MAAFNLTAELNLRGPSNLNQVVGNIKRQLSTVSFDLNINPNTSKSIKQISGSVTALSSALRTAQTDATALGNALRGLGASINSSSTGINALNSGLKNSASSVGSVAKTTQAAASQMQEFGKQSALAIRRFAAFSVATGGVYALVRAISSAYSEFVNFNKEFVRLQQVTNSTASTLSGLSKEITRLSTSLGVTSSDLLAVSTTLAQAGLSASQTKTALEALAKSALAPSFDNLNDTVEGSIALMRQFGISAGDLESALGSINSVAAQFAVESGDIITAIQRTGGVFAAASKGVSEGKDALNEFIAVFTSVRQTTRESAETIATGLRTIFTRIQRGGTIEALREFGISLTDIEGKFVGPFEAVKRLSEGLKGLDPRDLRFSKIVEELGGFRQIGKVIPLIQQFATAQQALGVAQRGSGSLALDAARAQESLAVRVTKVREEFIALIRDIGQSQSFQTFADVSLKLASALISVASAAKDVLPALTALAAIKAIPAIGQFASGFTGGVNRRTRGFARGGLVPGSGSGDTVPAMLTPGEFVIRKKAVETIGLGNLQNINKYASGGLVQKFARGGSTLGIRRGARSKFKELTEEEIAQLSTADLIKYAKAQARDVFSTGGAGIATSSKFIPVPPERIVPELESSLQSYLGQKGFWQEQVSPFGKPSKSAARTSSRLSRSEALKKQESKMADEVAARSQQWTRIKSGSAIDKYLLGSLQDPVLSDYRTVRGGGSLAKDFHNTRLRQAVNKALEKYDDFDYSSGNIDKLVSNFASKRFADGGVVQKLARGGEIEKRILDATIKTENEKQRYQFGLVGLRSGIKAGSAGGPKKSSFTVLGNKAVDLYSASLSGALGKQFSGKIEKNITNSLKQSIRSTAQSIGDRLGVSSLKGEEAKNILSGSVLSSAVGNIYESSLNLIGSPYLEKTESTKSIDFPFGLGSIASAFGIQPNIPTDATRTIGGYGKSLSAMKGQIIRFIKSVEGGEFTKAQEKLANKKAIGKLKGTNILSSLLPRIPEGFNSSSTAYNLRSKYGLARSGLTKTGLSKSLEKVTKTGQDKAFLEELELALRKGYASGGSVEDTVPALLTPGEFVINKKAAKRIGGAQLNQLNKADKIKGFNNGGAVGGVQHFAAGGAAISIISKGFNQLASILPNFIKSFKQAQTGLAPKGGVGNYVKKSVRDLRDQGYSGKDLKKEFMKNSPIQRVKRILSDPFSLIFGAGLAGEGVSQLIGGATGRATGSAIGAAASTGGLVQAFSPLLNVIPVVGPALAAIVPIAASVTAGISAFNSSIRESSIEDLQKRLETSSVNLDKSFERLSRETNNFKIGELQNKITEQIRYQMDIGATLSRERIQEAQPSTISQFLGSTGRSLGLVSESSRFGRVDVDSLTRNLIDAGKEGGESARKFIVDALSRGQSFDAAFRALGEGAREALALAIGGPQIAELKAKLQDALSVAQSDPTSVNQKRAVQLAREYEQAINSTNSEMRNAAIEQQKLKDNTVAVITAIDLFSISIQKVKSVVERASAQFEEAQRLIDIRLGSAFGDESRIQQPSRINENILANPTAYSTKEITSAIQNLGRDLNFDTNFTQKLENSLLAQRTLQFGLPTVLKEASARQKEGKLEETDDNFIREQLTNLFEDIPGIDTSRISVTVDGLMDDIRKKISESGVVSYEQLANDSAALSKMLQSYNGVVEVAQNIQKSYNDTLTSINNNLNRYISALEKATQLQIEASNVRTQGQIQLRQALGQEVDPTALNKAFENTILTLTSGIGRDGIRQAPTLDPAEIQRRKIAAEQEKAALEARGRPIGGTVAQINAYYQQLSQATLRVRNLSAAQQKLATDTTRASNALNRISQIRTAQEARRNTFTEVLQNINNPEWLMDFASNVRSLVRVQSGAGTLEDIPGALEAFERRSRSLTEPQAQAERIQLDRQLLTILTQNGLGIEEARNALDSIGSGREPPELKLEIDNFNAAINTQAQAISDASKTMLDASGPFYNKVVEAGIEFARTVSGAAANLGPQQQAQNNSNGGLVYASKGKLINFKPKGTDTVPAMLTPGEFVVNAKSTKKNIGLLKAINGGSKAYSKSGLAYAAQGGLIDVQQMMDDEKVKILTQQLRDLEIRLIRGENVQPQIDDIKNQIAAIGVRPAQQPQIPPDNALPPFPAGWNPNLVLGDTSDLADQKLKRSEAFVNEKERRKQEYLSNNPFARKKAERLERERNLTPAQKQARAANIRAERAKREDRIRAERIGTQTPISAEEGRDILAQRSAAEGERLARKLGWSPTADPRSTDKSGPLYTTGSYEGYESGSEPSEIRQLSGPEREALRAYQDKALETLAKNERDKKSAERLSNQKPLEYKPLPMSPEVETIYARNAGVDPDIAKQERIKNIEQREREQADFIARTRSRLNSNIAKDEAARKKTNPLTGLPFVDAAELAGVEAKARFEDKTLADLENERLAMIEGNKKQKLRLQEEQRLAKEQAEFEERDKVARARAKDQRIEERLRFKASEERKGYLGYLAQGFGDAYGGTARNIAESSVAQGLGQAAYGAGEIAYGTGAAVLGGLAGLGSALLGVGTRASRYSGDLSKGFQALKPSIPLEDDKVAQGFAGASESLLSTAFAGLGTIGKGFERIGKGLTFDKEDMRDIGSSPLATLESQQVQSASKEQIKTPFGFGIQSPRNILKGAFIARDLAVEALVPAPALPGTNLLTKSLGSTLSPIVSAVDDKLVKAGRGLQRQGPGERIVSGLGRARDRISSGAASLRDRFVATQQRYRDFERSQNLAGRTIQINGKAVQAPEYAKAIALAKTEDASATRILEELGPDDIQLPFVEPTPRAAVSTQPIPKPTTTASKSGGSRQTPMQQAIAEAEAAAKETDRARIELTERSAPPVSRTDLSTEALRRQMGDVPEYARRQAAQSTTPRPQVSPTPPPTITPKEKSVLDTIAQEGDDLAESRDIVVGPERSAPPLRQAEQQAMEQLSRSSQISSVNPPKKQGILSSLMERFRGIGRKKGFGTRSIDLSQTKEVDSFLGSFSSELGETYGLNADDILDLRRNLTPTAIISESDRAKEILDRFSKSKGRRVGTQPAVVAFKDTKDLSGGTLISRNKSIDAQTLQEETGHVLQSSLRGRYSNGTSLSDLLRSDNPLIKKQIKAYLESGEYAKLIKGKKGYYKQSDLEKEPYELFGQLMRSFGSSEFAKSDESRKLLGLFLEQAGYGVKRFSTGGPVYASGGKFIPFSPQGTDTIPAMLTRGEFVVNRKSAKQNMGLLEAINNNTIEPQRFNKGGLVNAKYYQNGGQASPGGSSGGGVLVPIDTSELDSSFSTFGGFVNTLSGALQNFAASAGTLANGLTNLENLAGVATGISAAATILNNSAGGLNTSITNFNTAIAQLRASLDAVPSSIDLKVSGSIPVSVTVTVNGGEGLDTKLTDFKDEIYNEVASQLSQATSGKFKVNFNTTRK